LQWPKPISETARRAHASLELARSWATQKVAPRVLQAYDVQTLITVCVCAFVRVCVCVCACVCLRLCTRVTCE